MPTATVRQEGKDWFVDYSSASYNVPEINTISYRVIEARRRGMNAPLAPELAAGLTVDHAGASTWQAYRQGGYLVLITEPDGSVATVPAPPPKVRRGIETRWYQGRWEKLLQTKGWVPA